MDERAPGFYDTYASYKDYRTPTIDAKLIRRIGVEHDPDEARTLLTTIRPRLSPVGKIVLKVPNAASPWGLSYQFGDLAQRTPFSPQSLRQMADSTGFSAEIRPERQGARQRRFTDAVVNRVLSWAPPTPPELWSANIYAILTPRPEPH